MVGSVIFALSSADGRRLLMEKRPKSDSYFPGQWVLPGGKPILGESTATTLIREMGEELDCIPCITLDLSPYIDQKLYYVHPGDPRFLVVPYLVLAWDGHIPPRVLDTDHDLDWFTHDEAERSPAGFTQVVSQAIRQLDLNRWRWRQP